MHASVTALACASVMEITLKQSENKNKIVYLFYVVCWRHWNHVFGHSWWGGGIGEKL